MKMRWINVEFYDKTDPVSIENYGKKLVGKAFLDFILNSEDTTTNDDISTYAMMVNKYGLENHLGERYFNLGENGKPKTTFVEPKIQLKVLPYELANGEGFQVVGNLELESIKNYLPVNFNFTSSDLWKKHRQLLLIFYLRDKGLGSNLLYTINYVKMFTPSNEDLKIIKDDYKKIVRKIALGKAHELSESDTMYLGVCEEENYSNGKVTQFYPPFSLTKRKNFCYKNSYMTYVLNHHIINGKEIIEPIIKDINQLENKTFEEFILEKIDNYAGKTDRELCEIFSRNYNNSIDQWTDLTYKMLGVNSNNAQEFLKGNIVIKTIRIENNGKIKEKFSLPPFKAKELVGENWENSILYNYFRKTKFLFVIYKKNGNSYKLIGSQLWNMPIKDLETTVRKSWEKARNILRNGLILRKEKIKGTFIIKNNLPKRNDNPIISIRPYAKKRYYVLDNGEIIGDDKYQYGDELPDGRWITKQSFWINEEYIMKQLEMD